MRAKVGRRATRLTQMWDDRTKTLVLERLRVNEMGVQQKDFKRSQMIEGERY